jgi:ureidoglycolate lyase
MPTLLVEPLTQAAFAPFGEVIEPANAQAVHSINDGTALRFDALARIDVAGAGAYPVISLFRAQPRSLPFTVSTLERHPLGSQAFMPLGPAPYLVVVAADAETPPRAFLAQAGQGVNFHRGTWHHPLLALERESDFLVVDRAGEGENCEEMALREKWTIEPKVTRGFPRS